MNKGVTLMIDSGVGGLSVLALAHQKLPREDFIFFADAAYAPYGDKTPAEIRAFRTMGADAVGMSTVPEVIAASHCGMSVLAFSLITNMAAGVLDQKLTEEEVLVIGKQRGYVLQSLVRGILDLL